MNKLLLSKLKVCLRGGGDLASGIAYRLHKAGFNVFILELSKPTMLRRNVSYGNAVYEKEVIVENVKARLIRDWTEVYYCWEKKIIPVLIDEDGKSIDYIKPDIVIDARMLRRNINNELKSDYLLIGIGPGFEVSKNCHYAIETHRGHYLGRVIYEGRTQDSDGKPFPVNGYSEERLIRAPLAGIFQTARQIGDIIHKGDIIGNIDGNLLYSNINGIIRGLIYPGIYVKKNQKIADIDPRGIKEFAFKISDKSLAISGGVLEAILYSIEAKRSQRIK